MNIPRNALGPAYEAAAQLRTPDSSFSMLEIIDLLDTYSRRIPLHLSELERTWLKHLLHDAPDRRGLVYVEHLFDEALVSVRQAVPA